MDLVVLRRTNGRRAEFSSFTRRFWLDYGCIDVGLEGLEGVRAWHPIQE
jgi:hypothetical protein